MALKFPSYSGGGPSPQFSLYHVWKAYDVINSKGPIGRKALSQALNIGEGSTRTILDKMLREGCVENTRLGAVLTDRGVKQYKSSGILVAKVMINDMTVASRDCAVLVKGMADGIGGGQEQRDEAVRNGATGATTFVYQKGKLIFPDSRQAPDQSKLSSITEAFELDEEDVVIIGSAQSYEAAEKGAIAAALALADESRTTWNSGSPIVRQDTEAEDLRSLALAVHELVGRLPITMRSRDNYGVRCEDGEVVDSSYTGPVLEEALKKGKAVRKIPPSGAYRGIPVVVVPIIKNGETIAVFGIVDITRGGVFEMISKARKEQELQISPNFND